MMMEKAKTVTRSGISYEDFKLDITKEQAEREAKESNLFHHIHRTRILEFLRKYPDTAYVLEIAEILNINYFTVQYHLRKLCDAGIIYRVYWKHFLYYQLVDMEGQADTTEILVTKRGKMEKIKVYTSYLKEMLNKKEEVLRKIRDNGRNSIGE